MNGASKILTVSYGTFSCTLEGFEDPFNTMKAIAEYFRDLAAGDRYFGAEPPTPDAAMLHQIAEREIQRRVEAKIQDNGVVLRASDQPETPSVLAEPAVSAPSQIAAPVASVVAEAPTPNDLTPAVGVPAAITPSVSPASAPATETVVEKLSRLRSEIAAQPVAVAAAQTSPVVSFAIPDYAEDQDADTVDAAALADFLPEDLASDAMSDSAKDMAEPFADVTSQAIPEYAEDQDVDTADVAALTEFLPEDVAGEAVADLPEDVAEDAPVEELRTEAPAMAEVADEAADEMNAADLADADLAAMVAAAQAPEIVAQDTAVDLADFDLADVDLSAVMAEAAQDEEADAGVDLSVRTDDLPESLLAALAGEPEAEVPTELQPGTPDAQFDDGIWAEADQNQAEQGVGADRFDASLDADTEASTAAEQAPESAEDAEAIWAETWAETSDEVAVTDVGVAPTLDAAQDDLQAAKADEASLPAPSEMELRPGAAEKLQRARARVIRIRKSDDTGVPATNAQTSAEEPPVASSAFAEVEDAKESILSPLLSAEDEAELQRELASLRRGEVDSDADVASGLSQLSQQQDSRKGFEGPSADEALSRLMKQTDSEMEGSETKRRQSAIQHLKAAVAATVADRKVTGEKAGETETVSRLARYRSDLAMAVKAALPGGRGAATGERPAPLVLVSEQRIDRPRPSVGQSGATGSAPAPIRPRRVTSGGMGMATAADLDMTEDDEDEAGDDASNMFGDNGGFSDFVERIGATSFEQILEASAAYLAGVEGRPHFSRPQLMRHLTAVVPQGSFQREDGLRSFGTLLRDGRIAKVRRGQFTLSEESAYLAEARKLAE